MSSTVFALLQSSDVKVLPCSHPQQMFQWSDAWLLLLEIELQRSAIIIGEFLYSN